MTERIRFRLAVLRHDLNRKREGFWHWLARHLPRQLTYWSVVVAAVQAAGNDSSPAGVTSVEMLKALDPDE